MNSAVLTTIQLNNHGVSLLESKRYSEAARCFRTAANSLKAVLSVAEGPSSSPLSSSSSSPGQRQKQQSCYHQPMTQQQQQQQQLQVQQQWHNDDVMDYSTTNNNDDSFRHPCYHKSNNYYYCHDGQQQQHTQQYQQRKTYYIFQKGFRISTNFGYHTRCPKCPTSYYAVTCLFNLALTHHLSALEEITNKIEGTANNDVYTNLRTAAKLYELSYRILMDHDETDEEENDGITDMGSDNRGLCILALLNNLGTIHLMLNQKELSKNCFEQLLSILMYLIECGLDTNDHTKMSSHEFDGFLSSVMGLLLSNPLSAPAA